MDEKLPILVVEDEEPIRRGLCDLLAYHGYAPAGAAEKATASDSENAKMPLELRSVI